MPPSKMASTTPNCNKTRTKRARNLGQISRVFHQNRLICTSSSVFRHVITFLSNSYPCPILKIIIPTVIFKIKSCILTQDLASSCNKVSRILDHCKES